MGKYVNSKEEIEELPPRAPIDTIETRAVLKKLTTTRAALAELKGVAATIPNEQILIDTLSLQEAKDSSAIENIVTTQDELYRSDFQEKKYSTPAAKEVHLYAEGLRIGFDAILKHKPITINLILQIQETIEGNKAGLRKLTGTVLKNDHTGEVIYTPPQDYNTIVRLLTNLEKFINDSKEYSVDPLIKMAIIHHQFESIHPFYDGNGRTGRIINILFLIKENLIDLPILYISRYIINTRGTYYKLLQETRRSQQWEDWIMYILKAVEETAIESVIVIKEIKKLMQTYKDVIRDADPKMYSQDLINNLFRHPYTKIKLLEKDLRISRITATKYLEKLCKMGLLNKLKIGRNNYYLNVPLLDLISGKI